MGGINVTCRGELLRACQGSAMSAGDGLLRLRYGFGQAGLNRERGMLAVSGQGAGHGDRMGW